MKTFRLRNKFLLLLTIVSVVPLIFTGYLTYVRFEQTLKDEALRLGQQLTSTAAVEIKSFIVSQAKVLDTVATIYNPESSVPSQTEQQLIENLLYRSDNFSDISIVDKNGQEIVRENRILVIGPKDLRNVNDSDAFRTVQEKGIYISPLYIERGRPFFDLGRWILDSQGSFSGAVFAEVDARIMPEVMRNVSGIAGQGGRVFMVNNKGIVIAHPDLSYILAERDLSALPPIHNIVSGNINSSNSQTYTNENGISVLGSASEVTIDPSDINLKESFPVNWFVIAEQKSGVVFSEANQTVFFSIGIILMVMLTSFFAAVFFAQFLSTPVEELYGAAVEFGKGNLKYRAKAHTRDEIGNLAGSFNTMADRLSNSIDNLKEKEKIILAERDQLSIILSGITDAVIAVDRDRNIVLFNKAAETLTGLDAKNVMGVSIGKTFKLFEKDIELEPELYCPIEKKQKEGVVLDKKKLKLVDHKNEEYFVNLAAGSIRGGYEINVACILTFQDITREGAMEQTKSEFVSVAAHQLRTPLTGIKWSIEYLLSGEGGQLLPDQKQVVSDAYTATNHIINLVNDLLDVSRIEEGRFGFHLEKQSMTSLFNHIVDTYQKIAEKKGIQLNVQIPALLPQVNIDGEKMEIALSNLVDNAIKYTLTGKNVIMKAETMDSELSIIVKDEGIGIPHSDFKRIFNKFFRSPQAILAHTNGTGLGLYVSKNIIEQHGGKIWFDSDEHKGTTFYITLPLAT